MTNARLSQIHDYECRTASGRRNQGSLICAFRVQYVICFVLEREKDVAVSLYPCEEVCGVVYTRTLPDLELSDLFFKAVYVHLS